ncbi:MAG: hypothetical protein ACXWV5_11320 [Flavitalea sp.]
MKLIKSLMFVMASGVLLTACSKDDVAEENSNELITTIELKITERGTNNTLSFEFEDLDGPGGQNPEIDQIVLSPEKTYDVTIEVYDYSKNPPVEIHEEIDEESTSHRFYLEPSANSNITISNYDLDVNGVPLGLSSVWNTGAAGSGTVKVTLRHYEDRGKETSDPVNSNKSTTDAEVTFNTVIVI